MVDHVNGRGKEYLEVGIAGRIGDAFRQEGFARPRIANENDVTVGGDEVEVAQRQDTSFLLLSGFMVVEVELVNRQFFGEGGLAPAEMDGVVPAVLQFEVRQEIEGCNNIEVSLRGLLQRGVELLEHAFETEVGELVCEPLGVRHARVLLITKASYSARAGSSSRIWLRWDCLSRTG